MILAIVTGPHHQGPLPPHPSPPPRRGEGRVGVMRLEIFMQRLGIFLMETESYDQQG
jgi:hypothetical protein